MVPRFVGAQLLAIGANARSLSGALDFNPPTAWLKSRDLIPILHQSELTI
jgi:hypothetical protein